MAVMQALTAQRLIDKYLTFFKERGHAVIPSAPLVPHDDPSTLFISAGMHPLVPYLLGEPHPLGKRLTNAQKCLRTVDIENVGDTTHHTFLLMLGNWSLGDYFKRESIALSFEFLTKVLRIDPKVINVTVFAGGANAPFDRESQEAWLEVGIPQTRIFALGKKENWWDAGEVGPGGPDSEIFIDTGAEKCHPNCNPACACGKYIEIWNNVFIAFNRQKDGTYKPLKQRNVDTGMGVARTAAVTQGHFDDYQTELFSPIVSKIEELSNTKYLPSYPTHPSLPQQESKVRNIRIIADHIRAAVFITSEGVEPSKTEQGYVLRRLIRRAIREGKKLGIETNFVKELAKIVFDIYTPLFPELRENQSKIEDILETEEKTFRKTLATGLRQFEKLSCKVRAKTISGQQAFDLYQNYGFPLELSSEMAAEKGFTLDKKGFEKKFLEHQVKSRTAAAGHFKGGLAEQCEETIKLHTATHLLNQALRVVLDDQSIVQRGSNITPERLRFDFAFGRRLEPQEITKVEDLVNEKIAANLPVDAFEMNPQEAQGRGAQAQFGHKYGEKVKVFFIGNPKTPYSMEICGGPHVSSTGTLGRFKILKQESVGKEVRRIKATLEKN